MRRANLTALAVATVLLALPTVEASAAPGYPDLRTVTPSELRFDTETISGSTHWVLRFSNTVWNAGAGRLELYGVTFSESGTTKTRVYQRVYDGPSYTSYHVGDFVWHSAHNHFHFENFAQYELWTKAEYDQWVASGRSVGQARKRGTKTTFCIMDTYRVSALPGSPSSARYSSCGQTLQGLSVGWGDTYRYYLADQWVDLGTSRLADGQYVLRSVADPRNVLYESPLRSGTQESAVSNEATRCFLIRRGRIRSC